MYYVLFYKTVDNYVEKRAPYREEHLAYANAAHDRGELVIAGALDEPADGAVWCSRAKPAPWPWTSRRMILSFELD